MISKWSLILSKLVSRQAISINELERVVNLQDVNVATQIELIEAALAEVCISDMMLTKLQELKPDENI